MIPDYLLQEEQQERRNVDATEPLFAIQRLPNLGPLQAPATYPMRKSIKTKHPRPRLQG